MVNKLNKSIFVEPTKTAPQPNPVASTKWTIPMTQKERDALEFLKDLEF